MADNTLYELLGVQRGVSDHELKKVRHSYNLHRYRVSDTITKTLVFNSDVSVHGHRECIYAFLMCDSACVSLSLHSIERSNNSPLVKS